MAGRAPYGARGLKLIFLFFVAYATDSRAPYGARGLKLLLTMGILLIGGRAPYGARGLKY